MEKNKKVSSTNAAAAAAVAMVAYYGVMTASKALGMDSSNSMYYVMFGIAFLMLGYKYLITEYTLKEIAFDVLFVCVGAVCFVISRDMTVLLLSLTIVGLKGCDFKDLIKTALATRLIITSIMIIASFLGVFDQGETAQVTTSFQDITVYNFGYSTANNAYINIFLLIVIYLYLNYEKITWVYFAVTSVLAMLMYTFTNSRTGTLLFFAMWFLIFCDKFILTKKLRNIFFELLSLSTIICALFSFFATSLYNPDGGYWSEYINRIFSGRLNITHSYHEALSVSLIPRTSNVMNAYRGFGFIDNAYMSVYFHNGLIVAVMLLVMLLISNRKLLKAKCNKELVFVAVFAVYAMMEEFPLNPIVNPFIMLIALVVYSEFTIDGHKVVQQPCGKDRFNKKQNVLLVHNFYRIAGGEDTVFANEKKMLEENGHRVMTYTRSNMELDGFNKFQKLMLPFNSIFSVKTYKEVSDIIQKYDIDIVHVHNTLSMVSPSVYYAAFKNNVPVVQTVHNFRLLCPGGSFFRIKNEDDKLGTICEDCVEKGLSCSVKRACYRNSKLQTLVSATILKVHRILGTYKKINYICLTEFNKMKLLKLNKNGRRNVNPCKIYVKPNFTFEIEKHENSSDEEYYVFVGRLESLKGIELLVDAFEKMPTKKLKVLGDGPLMDSIKNKLLEDSCTNIELLGRRTGEEYREVLANAKAIVVTSQCYETFGMGIAEAFSCKVPAIVGNIGNVGALVLENRTGIHFKYNSPEALIEAISKFEAMDVNALKKNAGEYYNEFLSKEKNYEILKKIYDSVCEI